MAQTSEVTKDQFKKLEKLVDQLQRIVTVLNRQVIVLQKENIKLKGAVHQQKNDIAQLSRKQ